MSLDIAHSYTMTAKTRLTLIVTSLFLTDKDIII